MPSAFLALLALLPAALAQTPTTLTARIASSAGGTGVPSITRSTAVASASAVPLASALPSQVPLPPAQAWCPSKIFCAGEVLQTLNLAQLYADPKTIVDKPTTNSSVAVLRAFNSTLGSTPTEQSVLSFVEGNFAGEGLELAAVALPDFDPSPPFLGNVTQDLPRAFAQTVHGFWTQLIRRTNDTALCAGGECESSLIPLNHTFVVPGGRFREQYYWDSYWIVLGLLESRLYDIANATLQNFMDELDTLGFIPNGGRIYYLNRSQPPMFIRMLGDYVSRTGDTKILERALPLADKELAWWAKNRAVDVQSAYTSDKHTVFRYAVTNTAPRPESYFQDYTTANDPAQPALNASARAALYGELASGAESGWDYSSRWMADPALGLRTLQLKNTVPVCLNSILYNAHTTLAGLYKKHGGKNADARAKTLAGAADKLKAAILDLLWDSEKLAFYDYHIAAPSTSNATSKRATDGGARSTLFSVATFYPYWSGIVPAAVSASANNAFGAFASLNMVLRRYNGTLPVTFLTTGQQWDAPNAWPPHQQIALAALRALPANVSKPALSALTTKNGGSFGSVPAGQLGLDESALPVQRLSASANASTAGADADVNVLGASVANGGNSSDGEGWADQLGRELANRYFTSALCSWYATGGEIAGMLPRLSAAELNVTGSTNNTGNMFEKFSNLDVNSAGRGGEYTVQAGFGWTNGVLLWVAAHYGPVLAAPVCPDVAASAAAESGASASSSASASGSATGSATASGSAGSASGTPLAGNGAPRVGASAWTGVAALALVAVLA